VAAKRSKAELDMPIPDLSNDEVFIIDAETGSISPARDEQRGIWAPWNYDALEDEAEVAVTESRLVWQDMPFSLFAVQCELFSADNLHGRRSLFSSLLPAHSPGWHPSASSVLL
jgi:hypothetical protein